jgi:hypothetical protein
MFQQRNQYLSVIDFLKTKDLSSQQLAILRAAHEEILSLLQKSTRRRIPAELSEMIGRKVLDIAEAADYDRAVIVQMVLDRIGVQRPGKLKH